MFESNPLTKFYFSLTRQVEATFYVTFSLNILYVGTSDIDAPIMPDENALIMHVVLKIFQSGFISHVVSCLDGFIKLGTTVLILLHVLW